MRSFRFACLLGVLVVAAGASSLASAADAFPTRPIRMVVTLAPGGPLDLFARLVGESLQKQWGQPVVVENRPGAASRIAIENVLQAPADGYSLLVGGGSITTLPVFVKGLPFDVLRDLTPVTIGADAQQVLVVHSSVPARSVADFVAYARANPGKINYGSLGRTPVMLAIEAFKRMGNFQMAEVPYKNSPDLFNGFLRGDVQFVFTSYELLATQIASGAVRPLAVVGGQRLSIVPDLPTLAEAGYPGLRLPGWYAIFARSATPRPVVDQLYREISRALQQPGNVAKIEASGSRVISLSPDASRERMVAEMQFWANTARDINFQPE